MPTVLRAYGFNVRIYTNDHEPAHVHVFKAGGEAKVSLGIDGQRPKLLEVTQGMSDRDAARALTIVKAHNDALLKRWRVIHE
jgi:hypothetical protein